MAHSRKVVDSTTTLTLDPVLIMPADPDKYAEWIELVRGYAAPNLQVTIEAETLTQALETFRDLDSELQSAGFGHLPIPESIDCPTCGQRVK